MCLIERKTYIHSDRKETVETTRLCNRAVGSSPCNRIERKNLGSINVVEAKPPKPSSPSSRRILTESSYGRRRSGVDISNRSSNSSFRPSTIMTEPSPQLSPASPPSTASSGPSTPVPRTSPLPSVHSTPSSSRLRSAQDYGTRQMTITLASQEQIVTKEEFRTTEQYVYQSESGF